MRLFDRFRTAHVVPSEEQVDRLQQPPGHYYVVAVKPPRDDDLPATLERFVRGIQELQAGWFGLRNTSPQIAFEIRRELTDRLLFQFAVPSKRLERKLRTHLSTEIPGVEFASGTTGLPVTSDDSIGGGLLTAGRMDWYPLRTEFETPPANMIAGALHRHAIRNTSVVIQILFQPVLGRPVRRRWWRRRAYQRIGYLRKDKEKLWGNRPPTPREKRQADAIEDKAGTNRFYASIRFVVIGAGEYTRSRVKELAGAFNVFENPTTGQYLDAVTVTPIRGSRIVDFCRTVADRRFGAWSRRFQVSVPELAALVSLPDHDQENVPIARP